MHNKKRMRLNQRILIIIFNYRKWFCVCFNMPHIIIFCVLHPLLARPPAPLPFPLSMPFQVLCCGRLFAFLSPVAHRLCVSALVSVFVSASIVEASLVIRGVSIAAYGFILIKFLVEISAASVPKTWTSTTATAPDNQSYSWSLTTVLGASSISFRVFFLSFLIPATRAMSTF